MPDISRALKIPGWMEPEELEWLAAQAQVKVAILEVGSFLGRSTRALADNTPGTVHAVDMWLGSPEILRQYSKLGGPAGVFELFRVNTQDLLGTKLFPVMTPSASASQIFPIPLFDMIFLDGAHDFYSVLADISNWSKCLKAGGLLCGHDYKDAFPGVKLAVDSLIPNRHLLEGQSIWWATLEKEIVPQYTEAPLIA